MKPLVKVRVRKRAGVLSRQILATAYTLALSFILMTNSTTNSSKETYEKAFISSSPACGNVFNINAKTEANDRIDRGFKVDAGKDASIRNFQPSGDIYS